ncbi:hypothetical protein [Halochromatium roseum]|uniref:hypothetical protein n=1 Tax=Halochromatium roseum TaxID=391920 RepID=UPI0019113F31|nr:hypothetical protein [Halochromatium roseum]MBK5939873.1 hypothetical protein [Halochromatium roseum]
MRILIYLPIIHSAEELGGLAGTVAQARASAAAQQQHEAAISLVWDQIEQVLESLPVGPSGWRLYQDGLPVCGQEKAIVDELAAGGSRNHRLLQQLIERGAELMGTESGDLLVDEYQLQKQLLAIKVPDAEKDVTAAALLSRRDAWIGHRINQTLQQGEVGILFIGLLHNVEAHLDADIQLRYPVGKPALSAAEVR